MVTGLLPTLRSGIGLQPSGIEGDAIGSDSKSTLLVELVRVSKDYTTGGGLVHAMRDVSLTIRQGEFVAIVGASGSGKSTLMNVLGCLDRPTTGTYALAGIDVGDRTGDARAIVRNRVIGFIFQGFNLLPRTTALENVELPLQYRGVGARERRRRANAALDAVGLASRLHHNPSQLSGGQQQRVAIARALVTDPPLLLADEPTGNLDTRTSLELLALLQRLNRERGITIVLVTHEREIASCASRVITMRDGRIVSDALQEQLMDAAVELARLRSQDDAPDASELNPVALGANEAAALVGAPVPLGAYAMMWVGELLGEVIVAAYVGLVLHLSVARLLAAAFVCGEITKAWLGAHWARRLLARPATSDQRVRMALWYTMGAACAVVAFLVLAVPLLPRLLAPKLDWIMAIAVQVAQRGWAVLAAVVFAGIGGMVLLRYLLLTLLSPRR